MINDDLKKFREWQSARPQDNENSADDDDDDDDNASVDGGEAPTRLTTVMCHLHPLKFSRAADAKQYLEDHDDAVILEYLKSRIDQVNKAIKQNQPLESKIEHGFATSDAVKNFIDPYARKSYVPFDEGEDHQCWPYPLVEKVVIAFRSDALKKGNVIIDAPGIGDHNKLNVDRAYMAVRNADKILVVTEMKRSAAMTEAYNRIREAVKRRGAKNVFLVLTHAANIDGEEARIREDFSTEDQSVYEDLQQKMKRNAEELQVLIGKERNEQDMAARRQFEDKISEARKQKALLESDAFKLLYDANNRQTEGKIRAALETKPWWKRKNPKLVVFCIDNQGHDKLSAEANGITALREYISNFPIDGLWETLKHHIETTWTSTFHSLEMTGLVTKRQTKDQINEQLSKTHQVSCATYQGIYRSLIERRKSSPVFVSSTKTQRDA